MTPRERLVTALQHKEPDRVPTDLGGIVTGITMGAYSKLKDYFGIQEDSIIFDHKQQLVYPGEEILQKLGVDTRYIFPGARQSWNRVVKEDEESYTYVDEWGITMKMPKEYGLYYDMVEHPLARLKAEDLDSYNWPDPRDPGLTEGLKEKAEEMYENADYALVAWASGSLFERAWYLRGFENFFIDLVSNEKFANVLLDKLLEINMEFLADYLKAIGDYIQVIQLSDDLGQQNGPLISLDVYRRFFKPRQKELFSFVKERTDAYLFYHSCGSVYRFIPDLRDVGVDILNPIQVSAKEMDTKRLKEEFGDILSFWGAVDTQHVLPHGNPDEVTEEVKRRIMDLAPGGGYVLNSVHNIQADVPPENIVAMFKAAAADCN